MQELPLRAFIRRHCPASLVVQDLDLVLRVFAEDNPLGRFRLVEHKTAGAGLTNGQLMTFGVIDALLRLADPDAWYYEGFYVLATRRADIETLTEFSVNDVRLDRAQFIAWVSFDGVSVPARVLNTRATEMLRREMGLP